MTGPTVKGSDYVCLFWITHTTPALRRSYRVMRSFGLSRYDANLVIAGICIATAQGKAEIRRVRRSA